MPCPTTPPPPSGAVMPCSPQPRSPLLLAASPWPLLPAAKTIIAYNDNGLAVAVVIRSRIPVVVVLHEQRVHHQAALCATILVEALVEQHKGGVQVRAATGDVRD